MQWKTLLENDLYDISEDGQLRRDQRIKARTKTPSGYQVTLHRHGKSSTYNIARLVATNYLGPAPRNHIVVFRDTDKYNPHYTNLMYIPKSTFLRTIAGRRHSRAKRLSPRQVVEIRLSTDAAPILAVRYEVSTTTISAILTRRTWRHLSDPRLPDLPEEAKAIFDLPPI